MGDTAAGDDMLRVELRFKNARLFDAIMAYDLPVLPRRSPAGQSSSLRGRIKWFCDFYDLPLTTVYAFINLGQTPYLSAGRGMGATGQRLCSLLEHEPDWLFPMELYEPLVREQLATRRVTYLSHASSGHLAARLIHSVQQAKAALMPAPDVAQTDALMRSELKRDTERALSSLSSREQKVLRLRFGMDSGDDLSIFAVAKEIGVTSERVRQIEAKAMRKMRHPTRSRSLRTHMENIR